MLNTVIFAKHVTFIGRLQPVAASQSHWHDWWLWAMIHWSCLNFLPTGTELQLARVVHSLNSNCDCHLQCDSAPPLPARESRSMTFEGFLRFMESKDCCVFDQAHTSVYQPMDQPLNNYFISSSHNTYLTGDQLVGESHLDAYVW